MMFVIDRIEEGIAVISDSENRIINVKACKIKGVVREGAVVIKENDGWTVDDDKTNKTTENMKTRLNILFNK